jgi:hypothetical protein
MDEGLVIRSQTGLGKYTEVARQLYENQEHRSSELNPVDIEDVDFS